VIRARNEDKMGHTGVVSEPWASSEAVRASMRGNRRRDTRPELRVRRAVHALGLRYRVDFKLEPTLRVRADMAFTKSRVAVFIDGCFWHGCPQHYRPATKNSSFWKSKIEENGARDQRSTASLQALGWIVVRFWEHDDPLEAANLIAKHVRLRPRKE
jgi:DNA mismatch endonuclease, patch repair protein